MLTWRLGEPVIRQAIAVAIRELGAEFILGRDILEAINRGRSMVKRGYSYSFDMLGEAARTKADALQYFDAYAYAYADAIAAIAKTADESDIQNNLGIFVKLSVLHPRYEATQREVMLPEMVERLLTLAKAAAAAGIGLNIDAEESNRCELPRARAEGAVLG